MIPDSASLLGEISRFVPSLIRIDEGAVISHDDLHESIGSIATDVRFERDGEKIGKRSDVIGWKEFTSLEAAAGLHLLNKPANTSSKETKRAPLHESVIEALNEGNAQ